MENEIFSSFIQMRLLPRATKSKRIMHLSLSSTKLPYSMSERDEKCMMKDIGSGLYWVLFLVATENDVK